MRFLHALRLVEMTTEAALDFQYPLHLMRHKRTFFDLKDCGTLYTLESMPYVLRDVNTVASIFMTEDDALTDGTVIIKRRDLYLASQYDKSLVFRKMMMDRNNRARFQCIQKAMALTLLSAPPTINFYESMRYRNLVPNYSLYSGMIVDIDIPFRWQRYE